MRSKRPEAVKDTKYRKTSGYACLNLMKLNSRVVFAFSTKDKFCIASEA